jgi:hypothetical protein
VVAHLPLLKHLPLLAVGLVLLGLLLLTILWLQGAVAVAALRVILKPVEVVAQEALEQEQRYPLRLALLTQLLLVAVALQ